MLKTCKMCGKEKLIPGGDVCGACRMQKSRAKLLGEDATREDHILAKAQQKKEKEDNDFRANGLKILALVSKMKPRMLGEEVAIIRAIIEPCTQATGSVARLKLDALANLVESGDLVEDEERDDGVEDEENEMAPISAGGVKVALTPSELRRDVSAALLAQGFKATEINAACNKQNWANGESLDQKLRAILEILRPPEPPTPNRASSAVDPQPEEPGTILPLPPAGPQRIREVRI